MIEVYSQRAGEMWCAVAIEDERIWTTAFAGTEKEATRQILNDLPYNKQFESIVRPSELAQTVLDAMKSMLNGEKVSFNFQFEQRHISGYMQKVLRCLMQVPLGYITTYKALADVAGGGPRAVGQIMASNPFSPLVPCHRVVKSDFSVGGYGRSLTTGAQVKRQFLQREDRGFKEPSQVKTECGMLKVFPVRFLKRN
jgi:O-6-methylguanine DNA methyltransferase